MRALDFHLTDQQRLLWVLGITLLLTIAIHYSTYASMVEIWFRSDTFLHGILIFPISAWLVWRRWSALRTVETEPHYWGILAIIVASVFWWLFEFLGIQVGKQLIAVSMLPLVVVTIAGPAFARAIAFPLGYLVFAVPFGEGVIPYLVDFTAFFTVEALQITGFPVVREGIYFSIPAGNFEVAKACSGIRYLLASLAIGTLYGYLVFQRPGKRLAFFFFALLLPIVANGMRAYGIVLIAHYSDMKLAVGVDHLIFGWMFFGVVMLFMFWVGDRFRDQSVAVAGNPLADATNQNDAHPKTRSALAVAALLLLVVASGPALDIAVSKTESKFGEPQLPVGSGGWVATSRVNADWQPHYIGATYAKFQSYEHAERRVDLAVIRYDVQRQGVELANAVNTVASRDQWRFGQIEHRQLNLGEGRILPIKETRIHSDNQMRLVWHWHEVNGEPVIGDLETKLRELLSVLKLRVPLSAAIVVSAVVENDAATTRDVLVSFLQESQQSIHRCLYADASRAAPADCMKNDSDGTYARMDVARH